VAYLDNLRPAIYESPNGDTFEFKYDELERTGGKKASIKELVEQNQADVQDLGNRTVGYPFELYFTGDDYQSVADAFFDALNQAGPATIKHPRWDDVLVLPIDWTQREGFIEEMRVARFDIQFITVGVATTPQSLNIQSSDVQSLMDEIEFDIAPEPFHLEYNTESLNDEVAAEQAFQGAFTSLDNSLRNAAQSDPDIFDEYQSTLFTVQNNIDELLSKPLSLAKNTVKLLRLPGKTETAFREKIKGYRAVLTTLFNVAISDLSRASRNQVIQNELFAAGVFCGAIEASFNDDYRLKSEIIAAISEIQSIYDSIIVYFDARQEQFEEFNNDYQYIFDQATLSKLNAILQNTTDYLINQSFSLQAEKKIILTTKRTPLDLCYELYGTIEQLDFFIESNSIQDEEFFEILPGREILYYV
jgi:hypothetical protein